MKTVLKYYLHLILLLAVTSTHAQFDQLGSEAGLSKSAVTCILKDSRGFIWFGTQNGLYRYDGYTFDAYRHTDSLEFSISGNYILSIAEDAEGSVWVGTQNNGLNRYNPIKDRFSLHTVAGTENQSPITMNVRDAALDGSGRMYFGTDQGVFFLDPGQDSLQHLSISDADTDLQDPVVYEIFIDTDGSLWLGTSRGLYHYSIDDQTVKAYFHDQDDETTLSNDVVNAIYRSSKGNLYIGTNMGLNVLNSDEETFLRYYYNPEDVFSEAKSEVQSIVEDAKGNLWIGSFGGGLIKIHEETGQTVVYTENPNQPGSIPSDYVYSLFYDDSGILWIGTYGAGLAKTDFVTIRFNFLNTAEDALPGNDVFAILPDGNTTWFGTDKGLYGWEPGKDVLKSIKNPNNPKKTFPVYCLLKTTAGATWVGTAGDGIFRIPDSDRMIGSDQSSIQPLEMQPNNYQAVDILCFYEGKNHTVWVGTSDGLYLYDKETIAAHFTYDPDNALSIRDNEVYVIREDLAGRIWIGTYQGLNRFNREDSTFLYIRDLIPGIEQEVGIQCLYPDSNGTLWIGTDNYGLIRFDPDRGKTIRQYTKNDNLQDEVIYGILEDNEQNLWLSTNNGIVKAIRQQGTDNLTFIQYSTNNWLKSDRYTIGAYAKDKQGVLYFGGFEGVTYFHPDEVKGNNIAPPVYITDFQLFFDPVPISDDGSTPLKKHISETQTIHLKHNQNVLRFNFSALNYIEPEKNRYAFKMENLEEQWNYVGNLREAQYMYIPPGEYVFRVKAANNNGVWNETGASVNVIISPPFTQTVWFYLIVAGGLVIIVVWVMHIRTRRLRAARKRLEKEVMQRTRELRETNRNLEEEIQERKKAQEALAKSEARFRQLIETMNEGFSVQDREGTINYVNPKLCEMFGMQSKEIIGGHPIDFIDDSSPEYVERFKRYRDEGMATGQTPSYEMNWKRKDGSIFIAMVSPKPIFDEENQYTGSVAVLTDITDLKNAEKLLISRNKDLNVALDDLKKTQAQLVDSEKMASLGQLTAGVAHEINNPINFVSGNVQPLRRDINDILEVLKKYDSVVDQLNLGTRFEDVYALKEELDFDFMLNEIDHLLDGIGEGASRTAEIVKGLRNFSRMDEHELKLANINEGLDSTLLILHNKIKNRITIEKHYGAFPDILCYPGQLNQVFLNLLNNAQEAIEGEGNIEIKTWKEENHVKVSIKDNGRGMDPKTKKKIFDPFFTTKEVGKGTGLGLSISFGIIEKHKGNIKVESKPGEGSTFIVSIPNHLT